MTCSTCTCHDIPKFVVFLPNFVTSPHSSKGGRWEAIVFVLSSSSNENLISEKLSICNHVRRPVSRDRRILVMEMEVGKAVHLAYNIYTTDILTQFFVLQIALLILV